MNYHRKNNYWDITYSPDDNEIVSEYSWNELEHNVGPRRVVCNFGILPDIVPPRFKEILFTECDITGTLSNHIFSNCTFNYCYWNRTEWENIKFQKCKFYNSSIALATFKMCQFIDCEFDKISISGNETVFKDCIIDSDALVSATYTNLDKETLRKQGTTPCYQKYRLEGSKAELARMLCTQNNFASKHFYISIKVATLQDVRSRIATYRYTISQSGFLKKTWYSLVSLPACCLERIILNVMGAINGWGEKLARVLVVGIFIIFLFSIIYYIRYNWSLGESFIAASDITFVVGYTKSRYNGTDWLLFCNMLLGLFWYSIAIPTVISKITRSRF